MTDISIHNLVKAFEEDKNVLDGLSFEVTAGERVGLLGRNGAGKTTLFRILAGEFDSDEGDAVVAPGRRLGLISQIPVYPEGYSVEDVLKTAHNRVYRLEERLTQLRAEMAKPEPGRDLMREYDRLTADFERLDGYNIDVMRARIANGLTITPEMQRQLFSSLSGGEKTRVNLARLILEDTDILLLDEPTNHLDMHATEWLEGFLLKFKGTVLAISHDRYFLDRVTQRTIEIVDGCAEQYSGNYSFYVIEKQRRLDEQQTRYEREQKEARRLQRSADRLYNWGTGNAALMKKSKAIEKRIERLTQTDRPRSDKNIRAGFRQSEFRGDDVLVMEAISKQYGERVLFRDLTLRVGAGERIALIGDNGSGKSTLISIITGETEPDTGRSRLGDAITSAYLPQIVNFQKTDRSVLDTVVFEAGVSPQTARDRLGAYLFSGEDVFRPVWALSGGEKSRLRLCILMKDEINLLILDEPTNHLDIASREWMESAIGDFEETLLFVSHDRYFIDRFATRIWELEDGEFRDYRGGFAQYRDYRERMRSVAPPPVTVKAPAEQKPVREPSPKRPGAAIRQAAKVEREIERVEARLAELDTQTEEHATDYEKLLELEVIRSEYAAELDGLYEKWEQIMEER